MAQWLAGPSSFLGQTAAKAVLMYLVALVGLRFAHRRTLSQWTAIDFAAAVAIGAIMGRTAVATGESFTIGAVALATMLAAHALATYGRYSRFFVKLVDHRVRVLVAHGRLRRSQMLICGITENDLNSQLRQHGIGQLTELRYVLYETKGDLTIVREDDPVAGQPLVTAGLADAAGYPGPMADEP